MTKTAYITGLHFNCCTPFSLLTYLICSFGTCKSQKILKPSLPADLRPCRWRGDNYKMKRSRSDSIKQSDLAIWYFDRAHCVKEEWRHNLSKANVVQKRSKHANFCCHMQTILKKFIVGCMNAKQKIFTTVCTVFHKLYRPWLRLNESYNFLVFTSLLFLQTEHHSAAILLLEHLDGHLHEVHQHLHVSLETRSKKNFSSKLNFTLAADPKKQSDRRQTCLCLCKIFSWRAVWIEEIAFGFPSHQGWEKDFSREEFWVSQGFSVRLLPLVWLQRGTREWQGEQKMRRFTLDWTPVVGCRRNELYLVVQAIFQECDSVVARMENLMRKLL